MKRAIRWVRGNKGKGICFMKQQQQSHLEVFVDTSFDIDVFTSIIAKRHGGVVFAKSMRQKTVKISTHAAELVGLSEGVREWSYTYVHSTVTLESYSTSPRMFGAIIEAWSRW